MAIQEPRGKLKESVVSSAISNVIDQDQKGMLVVFASGFDMTSPIDLDTHMLCVRELYTFYGLNYTHTINEKKQGWG